MYDEAGTTTPSSSFDFGGGGGGDGTYDEAGTTITTAQLNNIGPTQFGDSFVDRTKDYLGQRPTVSKGIGALLGSIIGNAFLPGIGGLLGGYLGKGRAQDYLNQYNLTRDTERDYLGGTLGRRSIYTPPGGINNIRTNPNIINPNTIPDLNDPFYSNMLYADASLRNTLDNILNPNLNVDEALDKEEEKRQREQELLQELRTII